jgi:F420-non-reducing hydrogenase iron-sulfur subunit
MDMTESKEFEPKIVGFVCNWCTYTGADLAGVSRFQYPSNFIPIRVMCTGAVDPMYIVKAFIEGADGVLIGGCHPGDCHYQTGNFKARRRASILNSLLRELGLDEKRLWVRWISASEGKKFAETVTQMTEELKKMGPSKFREEWDV